jgi:hypothetical protein
MLSMQYQKLQARAKAIQAEKEAELKRELEAKRAAEVAAQREAEEVSWNPIFSPAR